MLYQTIIVFEDMIQKCIMGPSCHGHFRMVVGFTTTCAISAYHH